jgi:tetratricopeptide (TPR) repeat protein
MEPKSLTAWAINGVRLVLAGLLLAWLVTALAGCNQERYDYSRGMALLQAQDYTGAIEKFDKVLARDPDSSMALFGKARCLYGLERYEEALPLFEQFITQTEEIRADYRDERYDAAFYRDKCKLALGMEVPQNEEAIPEEKMRY